jgi:FMN phosphatase YigB (HAD superfamily)
MNLAVLLDIDGVILRDRAILQKQQNKVIQYVRHKTRYTEPYAKYTTERLFKKYGHTLIGLRKEYGIKDDLSDFNTFLYDDDIMTDLTDYVVSSGCDRIVDDYMTLKTVCDVHNVPIYLFSNAPQLWCEPIAKTIGVKSENLIYGDALDTLKPHEAAYRRAETQLKMKEENADIHHIFVDDSPRNLRPIEHNKRWTPILFGKEAVTLSQVTGHVGSLVYRRKHEENGVNTSR